MNAHVQQEVDIAAVLNLVPYLDTNFNLTGEITLERFIQDYEGQLGNDKTFKLLKQAVEGNDSLKKMVLVDQSSTNKSGKWTDDLIQACTFRDADGNYYVTYRGTGDGRWADNGDGMTAPSTEMQEAAAEYFDEMAEKYLIDASNQGKQIIVTGHSKGGNEAQYVYMASKHEEIIDYCISLDGQGFSHSAIQNFQDRFGDEYAEKLENMYSVNGTNDFVHDLGIPIIPEENTFFVGTSGEGFNSYHALEHMVGSEDGTFTGLSWTDPETGEPYEQGPIGQLAHQISETMMQMNPEDLNGAAIAVMIFVDAGMNGHIEDLINGEFDQYILGEITVDGTDFVDLFAHGLPAALQTLLTTPEGLAVLSQFIGLGVETLHENWGVGGVVGGFAIAGLLLSLVVVPLVMDIVVISQILDMYIDAANAIIDASKKINQFFTDIKNAVIEAANKIMAKIRTYSAGYKYAIANPQISLDTYKLNDYAQRLRKLNTKISKLDGRLDSLYWQVGLLDLWNLMQADILTGYSGRLTRCANYLNDTAKDFVAVEKDLESKLQ